MKSVIIIAIAFVVVIIILITIVGYFVIDNKKEDVSEDLREAQAWQLLQRTYLEQECREKHIGQSEEMEKCFDRIKEEQRLNPPIKP